MSKSLRKDGLVCGSILKITFGNWDSFNFPCTVKIFSSIKEVDRAHSEQWTQKGTKIYIVNEIAGDHDSTQP